MKKNKKIILGLNGWLNRGHDASAALLIGNKIVAFVEEERFTRKRYSYDSLPINSIAYCLNEAKLGVDDVDRVVFGWNMPMVYKIRKKNFPYTNKQLAELLFPKNLYIRKNIPKIEFLDHHLSHISSALRVSGFKEANIMVLDGQGEDESGTIAYYKDNKLKILSKIDIPSSLGYMMEAACKYIGLRTSDAEKLMGLAGHGKNVKEFNNLVLTSLGYFFKGFSKNQSIYKESLDEQEIVISYWKRFFSKNFPFDTKKETKFNSVKCQITSELIFSQEHKDFAFSVQRTLEKVIIHLVKELTKKIKCDNLIISGGIGLNCTTNGRLTSERLVKNLYVMPATNDAGVSLGAALEIASRDYGYTFKRLENIYLGPKYSNIEILKTLRKHKILYIKSKSVHKLAAKAISEGKIVGWFQGRMEAGPRALGNRSILANPSIRSMHEIVNEIKSRENWRPLAPSILEEYRSVYFEDSSYSPFMLQSHKVKDSKFKDIPAVVHKDRTSRYQSVKKSVNEKYYILIKELHKLISIPIVLNTSFNIEGEPLVCSPEQAIKTFYSSAIDYLAIGDFWIKKR